MKADDPQNQLFMDFGRHENAPQSAPEAQSPVRPAPRQTIPHDPGWRTKHATQIAQSCFVVDSEAGLQHLAHELCRVREFAFDCETTGFDSRRDKVVGLSFAFKPGEGFYIPVRHSMGNNVDPQAAVAILTPAFARPDASYIAHNAKFDLRFLANFGIDLLSAEHRARSTGTKIFDTMIASILTNWDERHGLKELAKSYLGIKMTSFYDLTQGRPNTVTVDRLPVNLVGKYAAADADTTLQLKEFFARKLSLEEVERVFYELEMPLLPVVAQMEENGIPVDRAYLEALQKQMASEIEGAQNNVWALAGFEFTIDSPQQVADVLFNKLRLPAGRAAKTQSSTDSATLEKLAKEHPIAGQLLKYRELTKVKSTYVDTILSGLGGDGRLRPSFKQLGAVTGRFSCYDPNLQSVPKDAEGRVRRAVKAPDGCVLISADYKQIELRVLAHFSRDENLLSAFRRGEDVHRSTAAQMFGVTYDQVTPTQREQAKGLNFGLIYGMGERSLARSIGVPESEGARYYKAYFDGYPAVRDYLKKTVESARALGSATTLMGRKRVLGDINSKQDSERGRAERQARNSPIQGSAADVIKIAMVRLSEQLAGTSGRLFLTVHDELVIEADEGEADKVAEIMRRAMTETPTEDFSCPLEVDLKVSKTWAE